MQLQNKVAVVTGASSVTGAAAARLFSSEGAKVVLGGRRGTLLDELVDTLRAGGGDVVGLAGDGRDPTYTEALVARAADRFGGLDIGFNNVSFLGTHRMDDLLKAHS